MRKIIISRSPDNTMAAAQELARVVKSGDTIALRGDLGAGKTCFVHGLAKGLGFKGEVSSPTFALINEYIGGRERIYHFDMYRINGWEDLYSTGYFEYLENSGVVVVEWSENISEALPNNCITVTIKRVDDNIREITIAGVKK